MQTSQSELVDRTIYYYKYIAAFNNKYMDQNMNYFTDANHIAIGCLIEIDGTIIKQLILVLSSTVGPTVQLIFTKIPHAA